MQFPRILVAVSAAVGLLVPFGALAQARPDAEIVVPRSRTAPSSLPAGFTDRVVFDGLTNPSVIEFAPAGRVFVAERGGRVELFDGLADETPTLVADLSENVYDYADRGLLGLAVDPGFPANPYIYVLYTLDAPIGEQPPVYNDACPLPLGDCEAGARLSRLRVGLDGQAGPEEVLIEDWCQQYNSHSIGTLAFGPEGALYVGAGDGASFFQADWGQLGNVCDDPPLQGGALRAQDGLTRSDPTGLDGAILRIDPATGAAWPDNPLVGGDPTNDRIIAVGLRNPYRFAVKPGTDAIFVGDVGWNSYEEVDRIVSAGDGRVEDFGWPCHEGPFRQPEYDGADLPICEALYGRPQVASRPYFSLSHSAGACQGSNVLSAIAFYTGGTFPSDYAGAFFFADVFRECLWAMFAKPNGDPDRTTAFVFGTDVAMVDAKTGPNGNLFYVDMFAGEIREIRYEE